MLIYDTSLGGLRKALISNLLGTVGKHVETISPSAEQWVATHTLGVDVSVTCINSSEEIFQPESITITNGTTVTVELGSGLGDTGRIIVIG